jgi:hypothetical protein
MDVKRICKWSVAALAALLLIGLVGNADARRASDSNQLRTAKVARKSASGTITFADWADPEGATAGRINTDSLVVVDWISYTEVAGGTDENWVITALDDSGDEFFRIDQTATASTADNIFLQFPTGLPFWEGGIAGGVFTPTVGTTCRSGYSIVVTGPSTTGYLSIGYHMEVPADRTR